eukprot:CAMPEP_0176248076 /NCGR_PEP_ID=MMETSP0121_2-20121125/33283_1 /TAXON_ID=160619 /ORGANISM="Kryptoperidinium foliaceum, Strain CCMP 1326" /LENGTH=234 /DNA_ID=CAMNT_0017587749 /DNA_START=187 /DNA_END=888 /DNA_ORIENTATION=-
MEPLLGLPGGRLTGVFGQRVLDETPADVEVHHPAHYPCIASELCEMHLDFVVAELLRHVNHACHDKVLRPERVLLGPARHDRRAVSDPRHGEQLRHRRAHAGCASRDVPRDAAPSNRLLRVFFDLVLRQDRVVLVVACDLDPTLQVQTLEDERVQIEGDMCPIVLGDLVECDPDLGMQVDPLRLALQNPLQLCERHLCGGLLTAVRESERITHDGNLATTLGIMRPPVTLGGKW